MILSSFSKDTRSIVSENGRGPDTTTRVLKLRKPGKRLAKKHPNHFTYRYKARFLRMLSSYTSVRRRNGNMGEWLSPWRTENTGVAAIERQPADFHGLYTGGAI